MEDPDPAEEWAIQEYLSEEESGKLSWIVNKGLSVGKKVFLTGFVISSAPLVLPPLVVISVIGLACSVPSGLFLASYACTDKLMSKLLPESTPNFSLDNGTQDNDEDVENNEEDVGLKGLIDVAKEEEEALENTWGNAEMRTELVDEKENDETDRGKSLVGNEHEQAGFHIKDVQEFKKDVNDIAEENGYQEYVAEYQDEKGEQEERTELKIESIREEEEKPVTDESWGQLPIDEVHVVVVDIDGDEISDRTTEERVPAFEVTNVVVELCQNRDNEELAREGFLEKIREEGVTDNGDEEKQSLGKMSGVAEEEDRKVEEIGMPAENKNDYGNVRIEKTLREIEHKIENKIDEAKGSATGSVDVVPVERKPIEPIEGLLGKRGGGNILDAEKSEGAMVPTINGGSASKKLDVEKSYVLEEERENEIITNNVEQDYQLNKEKEFVVSTNADAREIADESEFDLYDNKNDDSQQYTYADHDTVEGEYECNGKARISCRKDLGMAFNEKKIWQQMDAMRKIVGYKAAKQATCFEELKALYLFTGVEAPTSFKDPSDLLEINDKLRFLMSIVGVK